MEHFLGGFPAAKLGGADGSAPGGELLLLVVDGLAELEQLSGAGERFRSLAEQKKRLEELEGLDESDTIQSEYIDYRQNVEQQMIFQEEVQALNRILRELKKKDKELVLRRFYYLQSTRQIAAAMEMSENAVDSKLSRLRKKITKRYRKEVGK